MDIFLFFGANWYLLGEWFLGCLIFLYLLFPILKWGIDKYPIVTGAIILTVYVIVSIFYNGTIQRDIFFPLRIPEFAFGMYFVKYWKKPDWIAGIVSLAVLVFMQVFPFESFFNVDVMQFTIVYRTTIVGIASVIFVCWVCSYIKVDGFFGLCAKVSVYGYAVFLTHHVIITEFTKVFAGLDIGDAIRWCVLVVGFIMVAVIFISAFAGTMNDIFNSDINKLDSFISDVQDIKAFNRYVNMIVMAEEQKT